MQSSIILPKRFKKVLKTDSDLNYIVDGCILEIEKIISQNNHFFFPEFTDHGVDHINQVLAKSDELIDKSFKLLNSKDIAVLILSVLFHDIGMHMHIKGFIQLLEQRRRVSFPKDLPWIDEWNQYIYELSRMSENEFQRCFGFQIKIIVEDFLDIASLKERLNENEFYKRVVGEFIRRNHPRIAYELATEGYIENNKSFIDTDRIETRFGGIAKSFRIKEIVGFIARSHGFSIRSYVEISKNFFDTDNYINYNGVKIVYLMSILRIADFLLIDSKRISTIVFILKEFRSPISVREFAKHKAIVSGYANARDPEVYSFLIDEEIKNNLYVAIVELLQMIQDELDRTWSVLGKEHGMNPSLKELKLKYRRIESNIEEHFDLRSERVYGYSKIQLSNELLPLLSAKIYTSANEAFRELIQNSADAIKMRISNDLDFNNACISLDYKEINESDFILTVKDNGVGMDLYDINNYLLSIGKSIKTNWKGSGYLTGNFGIGFISYFLIGERIIIETQKVNSNKKYKIELSKSDDFNKYLDLKILDEGEPGTTVKIISTKNFLQEIFNEDSTYYYCGSANLIFNNGFKDLIKYFPNLKNLRFKNWQNIRLSNYQIKFNYTLNEFTKWRKFHVNDFSIEKMNFGDRSTDDFFISSLPTNMVFNFTNYKEIIDVNLKRSEAILKISHSDKQRILKKVLKDKISFLLAAHKLGFPSMLDKAKSMSNVFQAADDLYNIFDNCIYFDLNGYNFLNTAKISTDIVIFNPEDSDTEVLLELMGTIKRDYNFSVGIVISNSFHNRISYRYTLEQFQFENYSYSDTSLNDIKFGNTIEGDEEFSTKADLVNNYMTLDRRKLILDSKELNDKLCSITSFGRMFREDEIEIYANIPFNSKIDNEYLKSHLKKEIERIKSFEV